MSGLLIGSLILWLIIAIIVVVVFVYVVNWLYHRSSKEVAFVRTGFLGERVVIDGGAFVLPFIHDFTPVNMNVLPMAIVREKGDALITRDRMRIDIEADFYVRVRAAREAVSIAAATLGRRTLEPERLHALLSGKFVSSLRSVASEMTMEQMHEQRGEYVSRVKAAAAEALAQNGLELESVAITDLDQSDLEFFNPSNRFDAEGLTNLMEEIESRRKLRNHIEQESMINIRTRSTSSAISKSGARCSAPRSRASARFVRPKRSKPRYPRAKRSKKPASPTSKRSARRASPANATSAKGKSSAPVRSKKWRLRRARTSTRRASPTSGRSTPRASPRSARCASRRSSARAPSRKPRFRRANTSRRRVSSRSVPSPNRGSSTRKRRGAARSLAAALWTRPRSRPARRRKSCASSR
jgi:uncharacterized membrane protein YqiK